MARMMAALGALAALATGAMAAITWNARDDEAALAAAAQIVGEVQLQQQQWREEISRVQDNPWSDFDALARISRAVLENLRTLEHVTAGIASTEDSIANAIASAGNAVTTQARVVEAYKTNLAVVRNSARYVPVAAQAVTATTGPASLAASAQRLLGALEDLASRGGSSVDARSSINALRAGARALSPTEAGPVIELARHAEVLVERAQPLADTVAAASGDGADAVLAQTLATLRAAREQRTGARERVATLWAGGSATGLVMLLGASFTRRRRARAEAPTSPAHADAVGRREPHMAPVRGAPAPASAQPAGGYDDATRLRNAGENLAATAQALAESLADATGLTPVQRTTIEVMRRRARRLLGHTRTRATDARPANVAIDEMLKTELAGIDTRIETICVAPDDTRGCVDADDLRRALREVIGNAVAALEGRTGAKLHAEAKRHENDIAISILDNGHGMAKGIEARALDALEGERKGTLGVGLTLVNDAITRNGGRMRLHSMAGHGTVVRLYVPAWSSDNAGGD